MHMRSDQEYASSTVARKVAAIKSFSTIWWNKESLRTIPRLPSIHPKCASACPRPSKRRIWSAC